MAPTPGDKSLCFITGTRDGTRVASDRGGGGVVTNDSLAWQLDDAADPTEFVPGRGRLPEESHER
jgi:hypothetical protein